MKNLGAVEAANEIRHDVENVPGMDPQHLHHIRFVQSVCSQLGLDHSPENMHKVAVTLHKHDIGMPTSIEYPKHVQRKHDGADKIVHSDGEADEWYNSVPEVPKPAAAPEPAAEAKADDAVHGDAPDPAEVDGEGDDEVHFEDPKSEPAAAEAAPAPKPRGNKRPE